MGVGNSTASTSEVEQKTRVSVEAMLKSNISCNPQINAENTADISLEGCDIDTLQVNQTIDAKSMAKCLQKAKSFASDATSVKNAAASELRANLQDSTAFGNVETQSQKQEILNDLSSSIASSLTQDCSPESRYSNALRVRGCGNTGGHIGKAVFDQYLSVRAYSKCIMDSDNVREAIQDAENRTKSNGDMKTTSSLGVLGDTVTELGHIAGQMLTTVMLPYTAAIVFIAFLLWKFFEDNPEVANKLVDRMPPIPPP